MKENMPFILCGIVGILAGVIIMIIISRLGLNKNKEKASLILKEANIEAESIKRQAVLDGKNSAYELKLAAEKEIKKQRQELNDVENKLIRRESSLNFKEEKVQSKENHNNQRRCRNRQIRRGNQCPG